MEENKRLIAEKAEAERQRDEARKFELRAFVEEVNAGRIKPGANPPGHPYRFVPDSFRRHNWGAWRDERSKPRR